MTNQLGLYVRPEQSMAVDTSKIAIELKTLEMLQEETAAKITRGKLKEHSKVR